MATHQTKDVSYLDRFEVEVFKLAGEGQELVKDVFYLVKENLAVWYLSSFTFDVDKDISPVVESGVLNY